MMFRGFGGAATAAAACRPQGAVRLRPHVGGGTGRAGSTVAGRRTDSELFIVLNPFNQEPHTVVVTRSPALVAQWVRRMLRSGNDNQHRVVGMDTEWRPSTKRDANPPLALLQLSGQDSTLITQLQHLDGDLPPEVGELMANPLWRKAGVEVFDDAKKLGFHAVGLTDVGLAARRHVFLPDGNVYPSLIGLRTLAKALCGVELNKSTRVVLTDWSQAELTEKQVLYAALDSIASRWTCVELVRLGAFAHNSQAVVRAKIQKLMENGNSARHTRYARMLSKESDKLHEFFEGLFAKCVAWRPAQRRPWSTGRAYCPLVTPCGATLRHTITLQSRQHPKSLEYEARVVLSWPTRKHGR